MTKEHPITFNGEMVRAILEGRKDQFRLPLDPQPPEMPKPDCHPKNTPRHPQPYLDAYCGERRTPENPRGMSLNWHWWQVDDRCGPTVARTSYKPGDTLEFDEFILRITDVRVQRVQDISEADACAEGINGGCLTCGGDDPCGCLNPRPDHIDAFIWEYNATHGPDAYDRNDWVAAYTFERIE